MLAQEKSQKTYPTTAEVVDELKRMVDIGFPIVAMSLAGYLKNMILVVCMGKLGSLELASGALAIGFTNITGYSVLSGLAMGMEPLCTQAIGSQNFSLVSLILRRTILMLLLASLPISLLWLNLEPLMLCLHQNQDITRIASLYCRLSIPDLIANSFLHPIRIYLRSKGTTWPLLWCTSLSILIHIPIIIFLTFKLHLGVQAGYLYNPRVALATAGIVIQTTSLMYTLPTALSASVSTRVGNELGASQPSRANLSTMVAIGMSLQIVHKQHVVEYLEEVQGQVLGQG
ncbi:hypothetical protein TSUD_320380 [Trifolium subterraneum]|uniref:Polysaccharide biosynthesis protein C-terminal domain-containing protein n=1 Tax=Trifolium subterraneum TaxID=3900 RepID=A0A2Z6NJG1_TRISU|nr:hypothetical protein TSUD_320380 [Trifolium subterraneum]